MTEQHQAVVGPGRFQWNTAGWFRSQLGGTSWLLVGAGVLLFHAPVIAAVWLACFGVANVAGFALWMRRTIISPFSAIQVLLLVVGLAGLAGWFSMAHFRPDLCEVLNTNASSGYYGLLIVPAIMVWFYIVEQHSLLTANKA